MQELDAGTLATTLLEAVPDAVCILDLEGKILWWNDRLQDITGYEASELEGADGFELLAADHRKKARRSIAEADGYPEPYTMEFDILTKDGQRVPHEFNGSFIDVDGQRVAVIVARDVPARRERDREIRRQRDELETLHSVSETVHEVIQAVVDAATRDEIETAVCERLAASELYGAVWIGRDGGEDGVEPTTGVGATDEFIERVRGLNDLDWDRPAAVAFETGEVQVVKRIDESELPVSAREAAVEIGINSGVAAPIVHRGRTDGVLCVYSAREDAFSDREQDAFERLGQVIGFAINAVRTERLLLSNAVTELTFRVRGDGAFLASVSAEADGTCRKEWSTLLETGNYRHYVTVEGLATEHVIEIANARSNIEAIEHVGANGEANVFAVDTSESFTRRLLEAGATSTAVEAENGESTVVAELPVAAEVRPVVEAANELYDVELLSKREIERPVRTTDQFHDAVVEQLTDKQTAALRHAYFGGYFSWPRDATAEEIAERMNVSSPTFHYHIRHAQLALVEAFLQHLDD